MASDSLQQQLSPDDKVIQALKLAKQGLTRQEIADMLYSSPDKTTRLNGLRKLMARNGYVWDDEQNVYVVLENKTVLSNKQQESDKLHKVLQTNSNKQKQSATNKQVTQPVSTVCTEEVQEAFLTGEDRVLLQELLNALREQSGAFEGHTEETPLHLVFTEFEGYLHSSTMQLHSEVWEGLELFHKKHRVSKKVIVNEAIWDFLKKWRGLEK